MQEETILTERFELAVGRIQEILKEETVQEPYRTYFQKTAALLLDWCALLQTLKTEDYTKKSIEELAARNAALYAELLPDNYGTSYADPAYAVQTLGTEFGQLLCVLYTDLRSLIVYAYEGKEEEFLVYLELFLQVYGCFDGGELPAQKEVRDCLYWFYSDYSELFVENMTRQRLDASACRVRELILQADLSDLRYLYAFGEYVTDNELRTAAFLNTLPQEEIDAMAHTMSEGFRIGFEVTGKDLNMKKTVELCCHLGFERVMRQVILDFEKLGLSTTLTRRNVGARGGRGFAGADPNPQYGFDHKSDSGLFLDKRYVERRVGALKVALEKYKEQACVFAGPAVQEVFGEKPFAPKSKETNCRYTDKQQKLLRELAAQNAKLNNRYMHLDETSFTIIAYPLPEIAENYEEIFREIVKINTLDYMKYRRIQQTMIDALDQGVRVHIAGKGVNCTDLTVALHPLADPAHETNFENCVADVNIPVGEVFTSPVLEGTTGTLFVSSVYLNGLLFKNLRVEFTDGMVTDYGCTNFETEEENRKYIRENVLNFHDTLPMGEFAIGTNTTAYVAARRYQIADKLPILIAEKTGPHFAVGDTCYSHEEDTKTYNPDGKEIVAKENACSMLRHTQEDKAYFHTHLDITIPYDELGRISIVHADGSETTLIADGRFVLPGTEELNQPFDGE